IYEHAPERKIERTRLGLVGSKNAKDLAWPFFHFNLGHTWTHALHVARERILEKVLAGTIKSLVLRNLGALGKGIPCKFVNFFIVGPLRMGHDNVYIVSGIPDIVIDEQPLCALCNKILDTCDKLVTWLRVAAYSADIGLDGTQCNSHTLTSS